LSAFHFKFLFSRILALGSLLSLIVGCDSTPQPPTDVAPSVSKDAPPAAGPGVGSGKRSIKNRPPAEGTTPTPPPK